MGFDRVLMGFDRVLSLGHPQGGRSGTHHRPATGRSDTPAKHVASGPLGSAKKGPGEL